MMPQKKNPDIAELVRGKTGRVYGALFAVLTMMKGLPLAYNRDMQEDKEPLFDASDTVVESLTVFSGLVGSIAVNKEACERKLKQGYLAATDAAEYLVGKGVPFRQAHNIVGKLVRFCEDKSIGLESLTLKEYRKFSKKFEPDILRAVKIENCLRAKSSAGGTSPANVAGELKKWESALKTRP